MLALTCAICMLFGFTLAEKVARAEIKTPEGKVELYQLSPDPSNLLECYVIKTTNGKLIVIDGGRDSMNQGAPETGGESFNSGTGAAPYLTNALRAIAGVGENETVEVEAWFLSHAHCDHYFELAKMLYGYTNAETVTLSDDVSGNFGEMTYATDTGFKVNNFYFDFPNAPGSEFNATNATNWKDIGESMLEILKQGFTNYAEMNNISVPEGSTYYDELNGAVVNATAIENGLSFDIDGVVIEVLQTWSTSDGNANDNSMILRAWVDGQSVLFLNDAGEAAGNRLLKTYGAGYLESDIIQLAHHGQNGVAKSFYDAINAKDKIRLWSMPIDVWNDDGTYTSVDYYATTDTRSWLGIPEDPTEATAQIDKSVDIVCGLYDNYPEKLGANDAYAIPYSSWTEDVLDGMKISLPYAKAYEDEFMMTTGASIRLVDGSNGIRFGAVLTEYEDTSEYGFIILPTQLLTKNSIASNFHEQLNAKGIQYLDIKSNVYQEGLHFRINASIANILYKNTNIKYTGIAYEKTASGDYVYAKYSTIDDISRSVVKVALSALNELYYNENISDDTYELLNSNVNVLNDYVQRSVNKKNGAEENATIEHTFKWSEENNNSALYIGETRTLDVDTEYDKTSILWKSSNQTVATVENGVVVGVGYGTTTITAYSAGKEVTLDLTVAAKEGYLADFDGPVYADYITEYTHFSTFSAATIDKEYLPTYAGDEGVLKVTTTNNGSNQGGFIIKLPKAMVARDDGYYSFTIRYMIKSEADIFAFGKKGSSYSGQNTIKYYSNATMATQEGKWQVLFVETLAENYGEADEILINIWGGGVGAKTEIYLSAIKPNYAIDSLTKFTDSLADGYLADFSAEEYTQLASGYVGPMGTNTVTSTILSDFNGETNVMKMEISVYSNWVSGFILELPKAATTNNIQVRIYTEGALLLEFLNPDTMTYVEGANATGDIYAQTEDKWATVTIDYSTYANKDKIGAYILAKPAETPTINVYISYVMEYKTELDIANETAPILANGLTGNDLANFDSVDYEKMILPFYYSTSLSAGTLSAQYLEAYEGETGVVKVNTTGSRGNFIIKLPKAITEVGGIYTFTIKLMINASIPASSVVGFATPGDNTYDGAYWTGNSLANINNVWTTYVLSVPTGSYYGNADEILFTIYGGDVEMYVARVGLGNQKTAWETEAIVENLAANMQDGYLGEFNSIEYASLVTKSTFAARGASSFTTELVSVEGIGNAVKVTTDGDIADIMIKLPKAATSGMTLKFMIEESSASWFVFRSPKTGASGGGLYTVAAGNTDDITSILGEWQTVYLNYSSVEEEYRDDIYIEHSHTGATVMYIAWVKDGDVTGQADP